MGTRINQYPSTTTYQDNDYLLIDNANSGTRRIKVSDIGGGGGPSSGISQSVIAPPYDPNSSYDTGDTCTFSDNFYIATSPTSGTFDSHDWDEIPVVWYIDTKTHDISVVVDTHTTQISGLNNIVEILIEDIGENFIENHTYNEGDLVIHDNILYRCTLNNISGTWSSVSYAFEVKSISSLIQDLRTAISSVASDLSTLSSNVTAINARLVTAEGIITELNTRKSIVGQDYVPSRTYSAGEYVVYQNEYYVCRYDNTTGAWDANSWVKTDIASQLKAIKDSSGGAHTYQGTTEPTVSLGNDGDIYLQYGSNGISVVYGKILGQWMEFPSGSGGTIVQALEHIANTQLSTSPSPLSFTGHVKVTLTDDATQQETVIESDNMQTNGLAEFFTNCGFMNSDNTDRNNLVKQLLGGMLAFDSTVTPSASTVLPPSSTSMVANAAYDVSNGSTTGDPSEMGNWVAEGTDGSGWKDDGSYHFVWEWGLSQGNGTIAAISLTSRNWGWAGMGNAISNVRKPSSAELTNAYGSSTPYTIIGVPCRLSISDSSVYGVVFDTTNDKIIIHKYRLPLTELNLKGTTSTCQEMQEPVELTMPADLKTNLTYSGYTQGITVSNRLIQDNGTTLICLSANQGGTEWGNGYDQKMWEIDPVAGTCTESIIPNLYSGTRTMYTMREAIWIDKDTVAWINGYYGYVYSELRETDIIYSMKRTNGTWGNFQECTNTFGWELTSRSLGSGRMLLCNGYGNNTSVFNFDSNTISPVNMTYGPATTSTVCKSNDKPMISYIVVSNSTTVDCTITVMRMQNYLATVWTPSQPFTKTSGQFMRIDYGVFFNEYEPDSDTDSDSDSDTE